MMARAKPRLAVPKPNPHSGIGVDQAEAPVVNQALIDLLRSWREDGDAQEQRETWEYLERVLDEDRLSDRKLFP